MAKQTSGKRYSKKGGGKKRSASSGPSARGAGKKRSSKKSGSKTAGNLSNLREGDTGLRLQKYLAQAGVASRRQSEELITGAKISVNGKIVTELGTRVDPIRDKIAVSGRVVVMDSAVYYLMNKPDGLVCSSEGVVDEQGRPTVLSLLKGVPERVWPVGRLDYHSRGLLLLTNDGQLASQLCHPSSQITKTYHVKFQGRLDEAKLQAMRDGVRLEDGAVTKPAAEVLVIRETEKNTWLQIGITQGVNRQLRRMGDSMGLSVLKIICVGIGDLGTEGLDDGQVRKLSAIEVENIRAAVRSKIDGK